MKFYIKTLLALFLVIVLAACGETDKDSPNEETDNNDEEPITAEELPDEFLAGNYEMIYNQTSNSFQDMVSMDEFEEMSIDFHKGVKNYELISSMPFGELTEYQWINDEGNKGIRSLFAEDLTIEVLYLTPLSSYPESDERYSENTYRMPITEEWFTFWGGTNELLNYHYALEHQRYAYDLSIFEGDSTFEGDPTDNESYHAFGKDVVAPRDGVVVSVENEIADNTPTVGTNTEEPLGNHVIMEHENNEYSVIAHLQEGTVEVREGDQLSAGDLLGLAGNSGSSSEPHIHFHVADNAKWEEASSIRIKLESEENPVRGDVVTGF